MESILHPLNLTRSDVFRNLSQISVRLNLHTGTGSPKFQNRESLKDCLFSVLFFLLFTFPTFHIFQILEVPCPIKPF